MKTNNHYEVLGLSPDCTPQEIKRSYHQLALIWHPDKHFNKSEAQTTFTFINEAYNVLSDEKKRKIYDAYGQEGLDRNQGFGDINKKNCFYEKGFQGTDKSAFDVLKDIFQEENDVSFFNNSSMPYMSGVFQSDFKSFLNENIMSSENEAEGGDFFATYKPTFMTADFSFEFPSFGEVYTHEATSAQAFTSFLQSEANTEFLPKRPFSILREKNEKDISQKRRKSSFVIIEVSEKCEYKQSKFTKSFSKSHRLDKTNPIRLQRPRKRSFLVKDGDEVDDNTCFRLKKTKLEKNFSFCSEALDESDNEEHISHNSKKISKMQNLSLRNLRKRLMKQNLI